MLLCFFSAALFGAGASALFGPVIAIADIISTAFRIERNFSARAYIWHVYYVFGV